MQPSEVRKLPVWALGMANCPTGFVYGFISTAMGILLAARHVPVARVGEISAIAFSPTFWGWLLAPVLDVHYTKRTYGFIFAGLAAVMLGVAVLTLSNLTIFTAALTTSCVSAVLYSNSIGGWAPDILAEAEYDTMSGWFNVANLGAAGIFGAVAVIMVRVFPLPVAAGCLALLVFAPTLLLVHFPAARKPEGSLDQNFSAMLRDLRRVLGEGRVWIGLLMFVTPVGAFALTNLFSTFGGDFGASERTVTSLNGPGVAVACSLGCLLAIPLCRSFRRRSVYLLAGTGAAVAAAAMGVLPRTVLIYAAGLLAYNFFQGFNYTAFVALELEIVGPRNALSGTMMAMLTASANIPISGMTYIDSKIHDAHGMRAMMFTDAGASVATVLLLIVVALPLLDRFVSRGQAGKV
jgi:MFS transporter, PAT family, beta-lactamase induction signal transducer AmpG